MTKYKIAIIVGSLREGSLNRKIARSMCALRGDNLECGMVEIGDLPLYNQDYDLQRPQPEAYVRFREQISAADGILFCTPEYNRGVPGVLKNAIDWASRPYGDSAWKGKPVAIMGASVGALGTARAQYHLRQCFVFLDMPAVNQPEVMISAAATKFDQSGNLTDDMARKLIGQLLTNLCDLVRRHSAK